MAYVQFCLECSDLRTRSRSGFLKPLLVQVCSALTLRPPTFSESLPGELSIESKFPTLIVLSSLVSEIRS